MITIKPNFSELENFTWYDQSYAANLPMMGALFINKIQNKLKEYFPLITVWHQRVGKHISKNTMDLVYKKLSGESACTDSV